MRSLRQRLSYHYHTASYLQFCVRKGTTDQQVQDRLVMLRSEIKTKPVVFIDWEHQRVIQTHTSYNFMGFKNILGEYYDTNRWAVSVPTFGNKDFGDRQFNNLDFLIYVNGFNKNFDPSMIDHSNKTKDFVFLAGKPHPHRVHMLKEMLDHGLLKNSIWSANSATHQWGDLERYLPDQYELPQWQGKKVIGYDDTTRCVHFPIYNDSICTLIPETLSDNDCHYISEKTCKPIMAEHIFVVLSGAGFLKNLRSLGFKTFHEHFDESYDESPYLNDRVRGILRTLQQIKKMDVKKLYQDMQEIRRHNREHFFNEKFYDDFNEKELIKIKNYFEL